MALYPKSFIQRLRDEAPVSQIIGQRVPLKKKGREFEACCPFHQEKTPSFYVNDQKGFYHCFGCSAHGDALKFLMEYEQLSYPQAIEALARELGIPLPELSPEMEREEQKRQSLQEIMNLAAAWYQQQLALSQGFIARDYLRGRGLQEDIIRLFSLGYSPDDRQALKRYLLGQGAREEQLIEAGLLIKPDFGDSYDRFRGRLIFPIHDRDGQVIAFGGRLLVKSDTAPKYHNSPETPLFHKGKTLYNWHRARTALRDDNPIIVAEGYMDVIALHQYGFPAAVAPLGTALTETHLSGLWRYVDAPLLCLDGDAAGQRAMWRSAELALPLLKPGKTLRFLTLPQGKDPDDFLRESGAAALRQKIAQSQVLSEVMYQTIQSRHGDTTPEQRAAADSELEALSARIADEGVRHHFRRYFREQRFGQSRAQPMANRNKSRHSPGGMVISPPPSAPSRHDGMLRAQQQMLRLMLEHPGLLMQPSIAAAFEKIPFTAPELADLQHWLLEEHDRESPLPETAQQLLAESRLQLPAASDKRDINTLWQQLANGIVLAQIDQEMHALQHDLTESGLEQIRALKAEKEALLQQQYE